MELLKFFTGGKRMLLLEYNPALLPEGKSLCLNCLTPLSKAYNKDPAGAAFHHYALLQAGLIGRDPSPNKSYTQENDVATEEEEEENTNRDSPEALDESLAGTRWKKAKKPKNTVKSSDMDYYKLLGLEQERWMATEDQITKAYRKVCLKMHPDKCAEKEREEAEEKFKEIQKAYEVLSNVTSRRLYDSTDAFDDTLPVECASVDFFKVYRPAFRRYARWSVDRNVPELGDEQTEWQTVSRFYDFWYVFKSWREFPHPDEEDPAQAECREHKRWIERQNSKLREKAKKDESKRLREFVDSAFRLDPRVNRHKDEQEQARLQKKREKQKAREDALTAEREEAESKAAFLREQEELKRHQLEQEKKERDVEKRALKEQRKRLRDLCSSNQDPFLDSSDLDYICSKLDKEKLEKLSAFLETEKERNMDKCKTVLKRTVEKLEQQDEEESTRKVKEQEATLRRIQEQREAEKKKKQREERDWTEEELRMLDKALNKFPQGTRKRWEQVTNYVRTRTQDEILLLVKERQGASKKRFESQQNWRPGNKDRGIASAPTMAEESFTDVQLERSNGATGIVSLTLLGQPASPSKADGYVDSTVVQSATSGPWTKQQELALVKALKTVTKDAEDRWGKIASQVPDKTKAECFKRFKELRETFRANKDTVPQ